MNKAQRIADAKWMVRYQASPGIHTRSECERHCGRGLSARGGGPCLLCAMDDLEALVGKHKMVKFYVEQFGEPPH